jgi:hypothetical protein
MSRPVVAALPDHADDHVPLQALLAALHASPVALRSDLHRGEGRKGDYGIHGKLGHICLDGDGFLLCVVAKDERDQSPRRWTNVKQRLAFCRIMQDGDDEGALRLDRLPTPAEAVLIREAPVSYRRYNKPALGPLGDSLDDFAPGLAAIAADEAEVTTFLDPRAHFGSAA